MNEGSLLLSGYGMEEFIAVEKLGQYVHCARKWC